MASDADSGEPTDETAPTEPGRPGTGGPAVEPAAGTGDGESRATGPVVTNTGDDEHPVTEPSGATTSDDEHQAEAGPGDDVPAEPAEVATKGRAGVFLALTCGFLVCLCCIGSCFTGVTVGFTRMANLETALGTVGEPDGWKTLDRAVRPWSASATVAGSDDSASDVATWLEGLGEEVSAADARTCLESGRGCDAELTVDGFTVDIHYGPADDGPEATIHVD